MLKKIYAVTQTSVYCVDRGKEAPVIEKIALRGESKIRVGERIKTCPGFMVAVANWGIAPFMSKKASRSPDDVAYFTSGKTSPIVALFLRKEDAMECFQSGDTKNCSLEWREFTEETVNAIGKDHPVFRLSEFDPVLP